MRRISLIAQHEFLETLRTRSFLISLVLIPVMLAVGLFIPRWLEQTTTVTRNIAIVDATGDYAAAIEQELQRLRAREAMAALAGFVRAYAYPEYRTASGQLDQNKVPITMLKSRSEITDAEADAFINSGGMAAGLTVAMAFVEPGAPQPVLPPRSLRIVDAPEGVQAAAIRDDPVGALKPYLSGQRKITVAGRSEKLTAVLVIPPGVKPVPLDSLAGIGRGALGESVQIWSDGVIPNGVSNKIERALDQVFADRHLVAVTGQSDAPQALEATAPVQKLNVGQGNGRKLTQADLIEQLLPPILSIILIYFLYINMYMLMSNTMEEKSNRIIEVLISSVTPKQLMIGKLLGSSLVALFMFGFSIAAFLLIFAIAGDSGTAEIADILLDALTRSTILPALFIYFVLGYFLFAGIFLTIGSFCENNKDIQSLSTPVMMFMVVVPLVVWAFSNDPNGSGAQILSWLPFFGPFMMMARASAEPAWSEVIGSISVQVLTIIFLLWLAERLFRIAILHTGRPPKLSMLWRALREDR